MKKDAHESKESKSQQWDPQKYASKTGYVAKLGQEVVALLAPQPGERILDLGCGDGELTQAIGLAGARVVGVDASPEMVEAARKAGVDAHVGSGHELTFDKEFDAVFSNAALHWMTQPEKVIDGVWRALKPGGRFVAEFGAHGNVATIIAALEEALAERGIDGKALNPWYFPTETEYRLLLESRGFSVVDLTSFSRPTPLYTDVLDWLEIFAQSFTNPLPEGEREEFLEAVAEGLRPELCDETGLWTADYARLRFRAIRP